MTHRPLPYAEILKLDEDDLAELFALGAVAVSKDRWRPAAKGEEADRTRDQMLKDKWDGRERPRLLARDSTRGYVEYADAALGATTAGIRDEHDLRVPPEPEGVDEEYQRRFSEEAAETDAKRKARPLHERLKDVEERVKPQQLESLERRIAGLERTYHEEAA